MIYSELKKTVIWFTYSPFGKDNLFSSHTVVSPILVNERPPVRFPESGSIKLTVKDSPLKGTEAVPQRSIFVSLN